MLIHLRTQSSFKDNFFFYIIISERNKQITEGDAILKAKLLEDNE